MAMLEKRVQVLFDTELYARLEAEARAERTSVGAIIREAVETRLNRRRADAQAALERLFARADAHPTPTPLDWAHTKDDLLDSPVLREIS
ncbi:ribbon-helix-helix protein, CopG family [Microbacterium sp.]|uniref:ribbon-helix-helix protein, CopG family n=1 Tax=Microbacterium sp. TaxID=51671 RepID=UPI0039E721E4